MGVAGSCCRDQKDDVLLVTKMDLSHCGCLEVPNVVFNAERCIETLILASNQISSLPPQLFHCQELKHLNLNDNCLTSIPPAIGSLMHLVSLKLDKNNLKELPENLKCCRKLKRLSLNHNQLKQVPSIATKLISLEEIYLNDCELSFLPASVGRLTKLKILELRNNSLCNLPLSMARLTSLNRLDIGDNDFSEFPACINSLKGLLELLIDNNDIEEVTDIRNLVNLEHFDASYNNISSLSETIGFCTKLNMLNLSFNYLEQLPESIGHIEQLETLHLEMNVLTEIPKAIGELKNLEDLNICNNMLCNIPISIGLLRKLKNLNLSRNTIEEFPPEIGSCTKLAIINASYNRLQVLPSEIGYLNNLKVLDLVGNFLMYLPITIINLRSIRAIWLSANQNVPLIPFTEDINIASGERFLTNIALPQLGEIPLQIHQTSSDTKVVVSEKSASWSKKIRFAEDEDALPGKLHRTPTPFPKELRAPNRKQHVRNEESKSNVNYVNVIDGKACEEELQPPATPVTKNGSGLMNFTESCVTKIREANIRRNTKNSNFDGDVQDNYKSDRIPNIDGDYLQESNVDYMPIPESNSVNSYRNGTTNAIQSEDHRFNHYNGVGRNGNAQEVPLQYNSIKNGDDESHLAHHLAEDANRRVNDEREQYKMQNGNPERNDSGRLVNEKIIYSNVVSDVINGNAGRDIPENEYKIDAQAIREMYHNDVISGSSSLESGNKATARNGVFEENRRNRPNHLSLEYSNHPHKKSESFNPDSTYGNPSPQSPQYRNENEKPMSKQDMMNLTEKMRSKNISPPCYEIAKMYSTKAALFEQIRLENCN